MKIDIERLIDAVAAENEAYNEYCYSSKTLYRGPFEEITTRKNHVNYAREVHDREQNAVDTLAEVFQMDTETRNRLYIATRAVNRWRNATQWARLIPDTMQDQIRRFIFGEPEAPNSTCKYCGVLRIENGMSSFELLQAKVSSLEATEKRMSIEEDRRMAAIDAMDRTYNNPSTPRRTRFELSIELPIQREALKNYHNERSRVSAELRGLRTAIDLILTVSNYGGEVTPGNRRLIESILI